MICSFVCLFVSTMDLLLFLVQVTRAATFASVVKQRVVVERVDVVEEDETKNNFALRL